MPPRHSIPRLEGLTHVGSLDVDAETTAEMRLMERVLVRRGAMLMMLVLNASLLAASFGLGEA
jgi:hypothetical protein